MASAAWAAWRGVSSAGSSPKATTKPDARRSITRPPKPTAFAATCSRARWRSCSAMIAFVSGTSTSSSATRVRCHRTAGSDSVWRLTLSFSGRAAPGSDARRRFASVPSESPCRSIRYRRVFRGSPNWAAAREIFPAAACSASSIRLRSSVAICRSTLALGSVDVRTGDSRGRANATELTCSPSDNRTTRSMMLASSRTLPGHP